MHNSICFILEMSARLRQFYIQRISGMFNCGYRVELISTWMLLSYNLSLHYEYKLLMTLAHFYISLIYEGWMPDVRRVTSGNILKSTRSHLVKKAFYWILPPCNLLLCYIWIAHNFGTSLYLLHVWRCSLRDGSRRSMLILLLDREIRVKTPPCWI